MEELQKYKNLLNIQFRKNYKALVDTRSIRTAYFPYAHMRWFYGIKIFCRKYRKGFIGSFYCIKHSQMTMCINHIRQYWMW